MLKIKKSFNILGIMNGTSMDAIDYVLCRWNENTESLKILDRASRKFPKLLHDNLSRCAKNRANVEVLSKTHYQLGELYQKHISELIKKRTWKVDYVAMHGQTVFHEGKSASLQIGEPSFISKRLGIPTIYDFRSGDIALKGQGAPLAGMFHQYLFEKKLKAKSVAFQNLGGISNVTFLEKKEILSFDIGPANMLMDLFIQKYSKGLIKFDKNGRAAAKGESDSLMFERMYKDPYFKKKPPKSCGREEFGEVFLSRHYKKLKGLGLENAMATLSWLTAYSIFDAYRKFLPKLPEQIFLCGGGANNKHLVGQLETLFSGNSMIRQVEDLGIGESDMEAMAFAYMGICFLRQKKLPTMLHTGAIENSVLGKLSI